MKKNIFCLLLLLTVAQNINAQLTRSIKINQLNADNYRDTLRKKIFGQFSLPTYTPDSIYHNVNSIKYVSPFPYSSIKYPSGNLDSVDCYVINPGNNCTRNYAYVYHPHTNNGNLFIYHSGHCAGNTTIEDIYLNGGGTTSPMITALIQKGFTVLAVPMIFYNSIPQTNAEYCSNKHDNLFSNYNNADTIFRIFFKSTLASLNYLGRNNFDTISMMGLSGGGWTTSIYPAVDTAINYSFVVAGSAPLQLWSWAGDYEQNYPPVFNSNFLNYEDMYVLSAAGNNRKMVQLNTRNDQCCFYGLKHIYYIDSVKSRLSEMGFANQYEYYLDETHAAHKISQRAFQTLTNALHHDELYLDTVPKKAAYNHVLYAYNIKNQLKSRSNHLDKNTLTYSLLIAPSWLTINNSTGLLSGTPNLTMVANSITDTISFKAEDASGNFIVYDYALITYKINTTSISQQNNTTDLMSVYPNPASTQIQLSYNSNESIEIEILNYTGQVLLRKKADRSPTTINISELKKGTYFIRSGNKVIPFLKN